jgi:hypothetical protein
MPTLFIPISDQELNELQKRAKDLGYTDVRACALALLLDALSDEPPYGAPPQQSIRSRSDLEAKLLQGLDSGPATPMTEQDWAEVRRGAFSIAAARTAKAS